MKYDVIIVGSGFAGSVLARKFAEDGKKVLVYEKRNQIAGNMYEEVLENKVRVHKYGPHIFHTNNKEVFDFLKKYGEWFFYEHKVLGKINNVLVPIPFNFKSLELLFNQEEAQKIKDELLKCYPNSTKISIYDLVNSSNKIIKKFGDFVYKNVFENYTAKQWNIPISEIDKSVINRVPVILGYDDRYFQDKYQFMPKNGYTKIFENLLNDKNITIKLGTNALNDLSINNNQIYWKGTEYKGIVIYTGQIDELFKYKFGPLPYRSLKLEFENYDINYFQPTSVVNYPNEQAFTRITEFKYLSSQLIDNKTTILKEYPQEYDYEDERSIPYYAIINDDNLKKYNKYFELAISVPNLYLCGRLAEYKYYNMDAVIERSFELYKKVGEKIEKSS